MKQHCAFSWHGLPMYAARCLAAVDRKFPIVATRPTVPIEGMDELLQGRVKWIDDNDSLTWLDLGLEIPTLFFQSSWATSAFNRLGEEVRCSGGRVILIFDNIFKPNLRQCVAALLFRTVWRRKYAAVWVCGKSGARLAKFWGFQGNRVYTGLYAADPHIFTIDTKLKNNVRPKKFIFIGQLVPRKGLIELLAAWRSSMAVKSGWELHIYGCGELQYMLKQEPVFFHGFQQPQVIAEGLRDARYLILPSHFEHWGLVVCEAAQMGCGLILSDNVGSRADLLTEANGLVFKSGSATSLRGAIDYAAGIDEVEFLRMSSSSVRAGLEFSVDSWVSEFNKIVCSIES